MKKLYALMIAFGAAAFSAAALADPPTVVGRLSQVEGAASIRHTYDQQWAVAGINYPVITGDAVWSDQGSRAAIQVGAATIRLDQASELDIDRLDDTGVALRVPQGVANVMVDYVPPGGIQLLTSVGQLTIHRPGEYHIDAGRPDNPTQLLLGVLSGEATFSGMRGVVELRSGQGAMVPPDQTSLQVVTLYPTDFDQWVESQQSAPAASAAIYPDIPGYSDLGYYGSWESDPDYGQVWYPASIEVGWAPYRHGHWDYVRPWGWTWIDNAPWGWAPFHYGRWAQFNGRWGWVPGEHHEHHVYAPALVAFLGGEPGEHMGAGIGWVPLGPHEVFHPYYPHSDTYVLNINRSNFHDEREFRERESHWHGPDATENNFANHGAVTHVSAGTFTGGQPVHQNLAPQTAGSNRGPTPVMNDFNHLPQPTPRPQQQLPQTQPVQAQQIPQPHPVPQPQQFQPRGQPVAVPEPAPLRQPAQIPQPAQVPQQQQPHPAAVPEYHPPQQITQPAQQYHPPQPVQQPQQQRPQPQSQPSQQTPARKDDKDKRDQH